MRLENIIQKRLPNLLLWMVLMLTPGLALATPVQIRFTAAITAFRQNNDANQPFDSFTESAAVDVVWKGDLSKNGFRGTSSKVLVAKGFTENNFKIGGGTCLGTLSLNQNLSKYFPSAGARGNSILMSIDLPHIANNNGQDAFVMDASQSVLSTCRVAGAPMAQATCFNPTRDCTSVEGSFSPDVKLDTDTTPFNAFFNHKDRAYVQFKQNSFEQNIPLNFSVINKIFDSTGKETDFYKIVWAGFFSMTAKGFGSVTGFDPFSYFNFSPSTLDGPPTDAKVPTKPSGPPPSSFGPGPYRVWIKELGGTVSDFAGFIQSLNSPLHRKKSIRTLATSADNNSYDPATGVLGIDAANLGIAPEAGTLQVAMKAKLPKDAASFVLNVPKSATQNVITEGTRNAIQLTLDKETRKLLSGGRALKLFVSSKFAQPGLKKPVEHHFKYSLRKRA